MRKPEEGFEDASLARRIDAGDRNAIGDLYDRYSRSAFHLARRILVDDALAEDVVQEVFLSVWRNPAAFNGGRASLSAWLMAMVHHKAVDAVRYEESQRRRRARLEDDLTLGVPSDARSVEEHAWDHVVSDEVRRALGVLSAPQREALALMYYGGYTQQEVARLTGVPLGTIKTRMRTGLRRLRGELGDPAGRRALDDAAGDGMGP